MLSDFERFLEERNKDVAWYLEEGADPSWELFENASRSWFEVEHPEEES